MKRASIVAGSLLVLPLLLGCEGRRDHPAAAAPADEVRELVCVLHPTAGNACRGTVRFTATEGGVRVVADLEGLTPNQKHAFHVHEFGDCTSNDAESAGGHYDPEGHPHGDPAKDANRHAGDFGNVQADAGGKAHHELTVTNAGLASGKNPVLGRSVIVHAKPDDFGPPTGNAGPRIACGVIGVAGPAKR